MVRALVHVCDTNTSMLGTVTDDTTIYGNAVTKRQHPPGQAGAWPAPNRGMPYGNTPSDLNTTAPLANPDLAWQPAAPPRQGHCMTDLCTASLAAARAHLPAWRAVVPATLAATGCPHPTAPRGEAHIPAPQSRQQQHNATTHRQVTTPVRSQPTAPTEPQRSGRRDVCTLPF